MTEDKQRKSLVKFIVTGVGATLIHIVVASGLIEWQSFKPSFANGFAYILATSFSYIVNTLWTFSVGASIKNASRFWITSLVGFALTFSLASLADALHLHYLIGIGLVVLIVPLVTFLIHSNWTYKE